MGFLCVFPHRRCIVSTLRMYRLHIADVSFLLFHSKRHPCSPLLGSTIQDASGGHGHQGDFPSPVSCGQFPGGFPPVLSLVKQAQNSFPESSVFNVCRISLTLFWLSIVTRSTEMTIYLLMRVNCIFKNSLALRWMVCFPKTNPNWSWYIFYFTQ